MREIINSKGGSGICNAEACYRLGLVALDEARESGELQTLWNGHSVELNEASYTHTDLGHCDSNLSEARKFFQSALSHAPPASFNLTKNILRCLALVTGPQEGQPEPGLTTASLIHISVGGSSRNIARNLFNGGKSHDALDAFDDESLDFDARVKSVGQVLLDSAALIPTHWNLSVMATCPTGELLVSSLRVSVDNICGDNAARISTTCIFPSTSSAVSDENYSEIGIHNDVLNPLDRIIDRSQKQLHGITEEVQKQYDEEDSKRNWWKKRHSIDEDLQALIRYAQDTYFNHDLVRQQLLPAELFSRHGKQEVSFIDDDSSECSDLGPGNLASRFEAAEYEPSPTLQQRSVFDKETERSILTKLTVASIKSKLASFGVTDKQVKKMRKAELIELLLLEMQNSYNNEDMMEMEASSLPHIAIEGPTSSSPQKCPCDEEQALNEPCTILILDEHLLRFPFESMELLSSTAVTRVPSLSFVLATLLETKFLSSTSTPCADPRKVKYVLDPESNLKESASTLGSSLNRFASENGWEWEGVVGRLPPSELLVEALMEENGLYLYCGHGGGEKAFSRSQVEELATDRDDGIRGCRASVVLMGCSSGKLQSINSPKDSSPYPTQTMHYEPEGIALSYLYSGAPCVVGNLWDVTDRDIDRYCLTLMEDFLSGRSPNLAKCVADARRACKLQFIVGSAPVCYGVPVVRDVGV